jgi:hypothetical protein
VELSKFQYHRVCKASSASHIRLCLGHCFLWETPLLHQAMNCLKTVFNSATRIVVNRFTGRTASLPRVAPDPVLSMVLPVPLAYSSKIEVVPQKIQLPSATNSYKLCKVHGGGDLNPGLETCSRPVETVGSTASLHGSVAVGFSVGKDFGQVITGILYAKRWPSSPSQKVKYYHPSWAAIPLIQSDHTDNWLLTSDEP